MHQAAANPGIEPIDRDECLALLRADEIGRLAVIDGGPPVIFPVNYMLDTEQRARRQRYRPHLWAAGRTR